ncbi:hypothetical protein [Spirosoma aerolatum]|uniref:hypothetical protein n=1 Tax=Spirosoma aerolatum TaxID=1211326 RepID=UPI0009ADDC01|nr:hypothetical protein [Spirosoma aerolatum]
MLSDEELIAHVRKAILPQFKDWVLFANGTYVIIEDSTIADKPKTAIELMKKYGPIHVGSPAADFGVISLIHTEGWVVNGHYAAMYTYVHPSELGKEAPSDLEIGLKGRAKRDMDGKGPKVIYVND